MSKTFRTSSIIVLAFLVFSQLSFAQGTATLTVRDIMAEPSIAGMRPEGEKLSPDGEWVAYLWSATGREPRDLYLVSTRGNEPKILVHAVDTPQETRPSGTETQDEARTTERREERVMQRDAAQTAREQSVSGIDWSPDSRRLLFSKTNDLYIVNRDGTGLRRLTRTAAAESGARWLQDSHRILYQSGGNLFVVNVDETALVQLTREGGAAAGGRSEGSAAAASGMAVFGSQASEDGARVAYVVSDTSKQRALFVPDYTGDFVTAPTVRRGWSEQRIQVVNSDGSSERAVIVKLPAAEGASYIRGFDWTPDSASLIIDRIDRDTKRRRIFVANAMDGTAKLIQEETDPKWVASLSRFIEVSPKGDQLFFTSEQSGFNHIYLLPLKSVSTGAQGNSLPVPVPVTSGAWEVSWAKWMPGGEQIIYSSTQTSTAERHFFVYDTRSNKTEPLRTAPGMNTDPQLSHDGRMLLYQHSEWNAPNDFYSLRVCPGCRNVPAPQRLTDTVPARFKQIQWTRPEFLEFKAQDGKMVKARVYLPPNFSKTSKYPAVVFVHGAGYLQNIINGWNNYYRELMFNHILTQRGYVVLDIDYRGSAGYGRDWRTDVYDFLGGLDFQDHLDGIDYIVQNYSVDPARVGMYGGSYGGFMAEMAAMRAPEHIACAAALRPVADWRNYFASSPVYTTERLGFPDRNAESYRRSSPISYADQLKRPLLILHGMVDDNVHFQDTAQLVQKLIELGKTEYFEVMFYPRENHTFTRAESWTDEYERILRFFDAHLQPSNRR
ncbi:MAG TPA: alpha/beta fold hydrolase [Pyrinomonadaceae bacterium]|nr:alpha/beta fold hydrolase [Pyrinomonadaceae bacterium]